MRLNLSTKHAVMIVPLFSGSGMRVKIVEGMMMGKVIITTTLGKEGIEGEHKQHFLVADDENQFMQAVSNFVLSIRTRPLAISEPGQRKCSKAI